MNRRPRDRQLASPARVDLSRVVSGGGSLPWSVIFLLSCLLWATPASGEDAPLVLSSERVWETGSPAAVKVEGPKGADGWLALYRLAQPGAFLLRRPAIGEFGLRGDDSALRAAADRAAAAAAPLARVHRPALSPGPAAALPWSALDLVETRRFRLDAGTCRVLLGALPEGVYLAEAGVFDQVALTLVSVSDLTLLTWRSPEHLLVYAAERRRGSPVAGAHVRVLDGAAGVREADTDERGVARFATADLESLARVIACKEDHWCVAETDVPPLGDRPVPAVLGWSDDPAPLPGSALRFSGVARAGVREVRVEALDAAGRPVGERRAKTTPGGLFQGECPIPPDAAPGRGVLRFRVDDDPVAWAAEYRIAQPPAPGVRFEAIPASPRVAAGEHACIRLHALRTAGTALAGAPVEISVRRARVPGARPDPREVRAIARVLDARLELSAEGTAEIEFPTQAAAGPEWYVLRARAGDPDGGAGDWTAEARVVAVPSAHRVRIETDAGFLQTAGALRVTAIADDWEGGPVRAQVTLHVEPAGRPALPAIEGETGADGRIVFEVPLSDPGRHRLRAESRDRAGRATVAETETWVGGADPLPGAGDGIALVAEHLRHEAGRPARFLAVLPCSGAHLFLTAEAGGVAWSEVRFLRGNHAVVEIPLVEAMAPAFALRAEAVWEGRLLSAMRRIPVTAVEGRLVVEVVPDMDAYRPGAEAGLTVRVRDAAGTPVAAELLVSVVDRAGAEGAPDRPSAPEYFRPARLFDVEASGGLDPLPPGIGCRDPRLAGRAPAGKDAVDEPGDEEPEPVEEAPPAPGPAPGIPADALVWRSAPIATDPGGVARVRFALPARPGIRRARVVAAAEGGALGESGVDLVTEAPLTLSLSAPAVVQVEDVLLVPAWVRSHLTRKADVRVEVTGEAGLEPGFAEGSERSRTLALEPGETRALRLRLTPRRTGTARWSVNLESPEGTLREEHLLEVRPPAAARTVASSSLASLVQALTLPLPESADPAACDLTVRLAPGLPAVLAHAVELPPAEPEGSVVRVLLEFVPAAWTSHVLRAHDVPHPRLERDRAVRIDRGLASLRAARALDRGWGWRAGEASDPAHTALVRLALADLREQGVSIPEDLGRGFPEGGSLEGALLHRWARATGLRRDPGPAPTGTGVEELAEWLLRAREIRPREAHEAAERLAGRLAERLASASGAGAEEVAAGVEALACDRVALEQAGPAIAWLCRRLLEQHHATLGTLRTVQALSRVCLALPGDDVRITLSVRINDESFRRIEVTPTHLFGPEFVLRAAPGRVRRGANDVSVSRVGEGVVFWCAELIWPGGPAPAIAGIQVRRRAPATAALGEPMPVRLEIECDREVEWLAVEEALPPGGQVIGPEALPPGVRFHGTGEVAVFSLRACAAGTTVVEYLVRPGFAGTFRIPGPRTVRLRGASGDARGEPTMLQVE